MRIALLIVILAACTQPAPPPSMPWIRGFTTLAASDAETPDAAQQLARVAPRDAEDYGAIRADAPFGTVLAAYGAGLAVVDAHGQLVARVPGFAHEGSADDLVALAVGDAQLDDPVIVVAYTHGGHRISTTSVAVYQLAGRRLAKLFEGPIEEHDGADSVAGALAFVPRGLSYRAPAGELETWTFDAARGAYRR